MKKALQEIKQQVKIMMHQSESLKEMKALLRLSDEIDNVLQILPEGSQAAPARATGSRGKTAAARPAAAAKTAASSQALSGPAPATSKAPVAGKAAAAPAGKSRKKPVFIDPGDIDPGDR